ncbi:MAG TPA: methyltransferase domain-containing protein [Roseiflexaceae bacterium]|nr:methyltransferase domain-containing protein [Roseiflexaceae bacterium]
MNSDWLALLRCPACGAGALALDEGEEETVRYGAREVREVRTGAVGCRGCGARFPVREYLLSFEGLLAPDVSQEAVFWNAYYRQHYERGIQGFADTEAPQTPFLAQGVTEAIPVERATWFGVLEGLARHPWLRPGGLLVDIGVGSGWSSLDLARRGFNVIAFDPAFEALAVAKRHAIAQGVYLEYLCSDMAHFHLLPDSADAVFALHSLHHVPDIDGALQRIAAMLREGGVLALDEHFQENERNSRLRAALIQEADELCFGRYRSPEAALALPSHASHNEGIGMERMLETVQRYLHADTPRYRHIAMDLLGPLAYLAFDRSPEALGQATALGGLINRAMLRAWPDAAEYVTLVAQKRAEPPRGPALAPPLSHEARQAAQLAAYQEELARLQQLLATKNEHIRRLETLLERISSGRLMRLLNWVRKYVMRNA